MNLQTETDQAPTLDLDKNGFHNRPSMPPILSIHQLQDFIGQRVEIIAFGISYLGVLQEVDYDRGTLQLEDGEDKAILEIERVEYFIPS